MVMEKLDKVIRSLDGCAGGKGCDNCPYDGDGNCKDRLMMDALTVIRSLEKKYATAVEMAATATELAAKYRRTDGEQELRTCYCPVCDKHFEVRSNASSGYCPDCGHHVVLRCEEVADV